MLLAIALKNEQADHEHLLYLNEQGMAQCAQANKHAHTLTVTPPTEPNQPPQILVEPTNGHSHDSMPYDKAMFPQEPEEPEKLPDSDLIKQKLAQFENACTADRESIQNGQESVRFREGEQWPDDIKTKLLADGRACLTINHVAPMIESLSGVYRRNRTDLRAYPTENGDARIAEVLTYALKNVLQNTGSDTEETEAFEETTVTGRGVLEIYPDFDADIRGAIKIRHVPWDMVVFGPHTRKDLEDCENFFRWKWLSQDQLINSYPEMKKQITLLYGRFEQFMNAEQDMSDLDNPLNRELFADSKTKEIRVIECEEKHYYRLKIYLDPSSGWMIEETELPPALRSQLRSLTILKKVERRLHRIRRTIIAGDVVLTDEFVNRPTPPCQAGPNFSVFPIYAYKRGAKFEGKVERAKDPQREVNKRRSQITDIVNTSINNGWLMPKGTFGTQAEKDKFLNSVSRSGFVVEIPDMANPPQRMAAGQVQPSVVQLEMNSLQSFRETTNVNSEMLGMGNQYQSGTAIAQRLQQGLMGNEYLFDNMTQVKKRLGKEVLLWIQELYTPDRIARLFFDQAKLEKIYMNDKEVDPDDAQLWQELQTKLKDADLTRYDVTIGETGQSPTAQLANFEMVVELAGKGVPLPPQLFIELAPIPNKARIIRIMEEANQAQAATDQKKYDTEIQKTQIAAQSKQQQA